MAFHASQSVTIRASGAVLILLTCFLFPAASSVQDEVPADLRPLLAAPESEMRLVVQRYTLDRTALSGNYANGAVRGGCFGAAAPLCAPLSSERTMRSHMV